MFGPHADASYEDHFYFHSIVGAMDGMVSGIFHNAVETKKDFISLCGVSCDPYTVKREAVSPKLPSCIKPSLAGTRSLDW
jgi:hypothetical protein